MSLNPALTRHGGPPEAMPGESFTLSVDGIRFEIESGGGFPGNGGNYYGKGDVYLSRYRLVFVRKPVPDRVTQATFLSFSLPLILIENPVLKQPIFGANYMAGQVQPLPNVAGGLTGPGHWKMTFRSGGLNEFYPLFRRYMEQALAGETPPIDEAMAEAERQRDADAEKAPLTEAFVDPSRPGVVFVAAPPSASHRSSRRRSSGSSGSGRSQPTSSLYPNLPPPPSYDDATAPGNNSGSGDAASAPPL